MVAEPLVTVAAELDVLVVAKRQMPVVAELHVDVVEGSVVSGSGTAPHCSSVAERCGAMVAELHDRNSPCGHDQWKGRVDHTQAS